MAESIFFVRDRFIDAERPPTSDATAWGWARKNLFASWSDTVMTLVSVVAILYFLPGVLDWLFLSAVWTGENRIACLTVDQGGQLPSGWSGACWAYVGDRFLQFMFGSYPRDELWRPLLVVVMFVGLLIPFLIPKAPRKGLNALLLLIALPVVSFFLLLGGVFGLRHVETTLWGGLMVTLIISFVGSTISPLITVLFMASVLLPLFLEPGNNIDKFLRALIGVSIFASAYMAEVIRGGLQAIPKGQYEAADALGLGYFQKMTFIILPQAIKLVIPGIVNTFIGMFKDTSLVTIISMYDLLGIVKASFGDSGWITPVTPLTGLIFAGFVLWIFCFGMSRYSALMERHHDTGHKR